MNIRQMVGVMALSMILNSCTFEKKVEKVDSLSGIYPHLAYYNNEGGCGVAAIVPWADRLWVMTYGPHLPRGSSDKLYEITPDLQQLIRKESVGGTSANRMIHHESNQLFIGPYVIDTLRRVRVVPYSEMPGRLTGNARHLFDPAHKIYYGTMEEGFYEVDVNSLEVKELYEDGNFQKVNLRPGNYFPTSALLPGVQGKGLYSGQGIMVYVNNGGGRSEALNDPSIEAGVLAEWNGSDWKIIRRNQFAEVTGYGGIYGNPHSDHDPIWTIGWDAKSLILGARDIVKGWSFYRLPKASNSYDGAHGWNTKWPRIRNVGTKEKPDYLLTMHGMFWHFPSTFSATKTGGIRPRSAYLKLVGDFTRWKDKIVFGCDDSSQNVLLNKRKVKGEMEGPGQSNSNLWFMSPDKLDELGPVAATGAVWMKECVSANVYSEPFLFAGWDYRSCWIKNEGEQQVKYTFEVDKKGNNTWEVLKEIIVDAKESTFVTFSTLDEGEWIRLKTNAETLTTVSFSYTERNRRESIPSPLFTGIASIRSSQFQGGLLYGLGDNRRVLGLVAQTYKNGRVENIGYYELTDSLQLVQKEDTATVAFIQKKFAISHEGVFLEEGSVLIIDDKNRRWRLPLGDVKYNISGKQDLCRICREIVTGRDLFNCHGTFYELPAENADGFAKIRPICSHSFNITDYASYRGLLVMTGIDLKNAKGNKHILISEDKKAAVWAGAIDDLWELGKPVGRGGPWVNSDVRANIPSDPYLIAFYDKKTMVLSHKSSRSVTFIVEIDPIGNGDFMEYNKFKVEAGKVFTFHFPEGFQGKWIRFRTDTDVNATAWLEYK